jgi:hypothetical protein
MFVLALLFAVSLEVYSAPQTYNLAFQSKPGDEHTPIPESWIWSAGGGTKGFGAITVQFPSGFTEQGGAHVFGDVLTPPLFVENLKNHKLISGTELALGVYTPDYQLDSQQRYQVDFHTPIQIQVTLDAAHVPEGTEDRLVIMRYDPDTRQWEELPSKFDKATFQIRTIVETFLTVPKDFPTWGGRAFFGVFQRILTPTPSPQTKTPSPTGAGTITESSTALLVPTQTSYPTYTPYPTYTSFPTYTPFATITPFSTSFPTAVLITTTPKTTIASEPTTTPTEGVCPLTVGMVFTALFLLFRRIDG